MESLLGRDALELLQLATREISSKLSISFLFVTCRSCYFLVSATKPPADEHNYVYDEIYVAYGASFWSVYQKWRDSEKSFWLRRDTRWPDKPTDDGELLLLRCCIFIYYAHEYKFRLSLSLPNCSFLTADLEEVNFYLSVSLILKERLFNPGFIGPTCLVGMTFIDLQLLVWWVFSRAK